MDFFKAEKSFFVDVANELGLLVKDQGNISFFRHPLAYLVEAADDICYTLIDFEDGINLGLIPEEYALEYLINLVRDRINTEKYHQLTTKKDRISYLRALAINTLIVEAVEIFMQHEEDILKGIFHKTLLDVSRYKAQISDIIELSISNMYQSSEVVNKEIAGHQVLTGLLEVFGSAALHSYDGLMTNYDKLILMILPDTMTLNNRSVYENMMQICHYISGLSDSQAMGIYHRIQGRQV